MHRALVWVALFTTLAGGACKDADSIAADNRAKAIRNDLNEGRKALAAGKNGEAVQALEAAAALTPNDPTPFVLLSEAEHELGNDDAAILNLRRAAQLTKGDDPGLKKQLAEMYRRVGYRPQAIDLLQELLAEHQLDDSEVLALARLQAQAGRVDPAFKTLEVVQSKRPDDPDARVVQAEILMTGGDDAAALKLLDSVLNDEPQLVSARLVRARHRINVGQTERAQDDIEAIEGPDANLPEVIQLKARIWNQLERYDEAESALSALIGANPQDVELLGQLAEAKLNLGQTSEAEALIEKALALRPRSARALYVRGRAQDVEGDAKAAVDSYREALRADPTFAPALSRMWRIHQQQGNAEDEMLTLGQLVNANEASLEERVTYAELSLAAKVNLSRVRRMMEEVVKEEPSNARYRAVLARLGGKSAVVSRNGSSGLQIIRGSVDHGPHAGHKKRRPGSK